VPETYQETIPFPLAKLIIGIFAAITLSLLVLLLYQVLDGPVGDNPASDWFYLIMVLFFAGLTYFVTNFNKLSIKITTQSITVGYGVLRRAIPWDDVNGCYQDEASAIGSYGGWGIRTGKVKGKWRLVYNVIGSPTVVLELKKGRFREFVFSTKNPEMVLEVTRQQISK
jgi:hypothetical protein